MDKKSRIKAGLYVGIVTAIFSVVRNFLTQDNITTKSVILFIAFGLVSGAIQGFLFGWLIGLFVNSKFVKQATQITTEADETVLFETGANHFKGAEAVGGKLYLTNKRLVFKSHNMNIQNHELSIPLTHIHKVDRYKTLGIVNNGLTVTADDKIEKFVVQQPDKWFDQLQEKSGLQFILS